MQSKSKGAVRPSSWRAFNGSLLTWCTSQLQSYKNWAYFDLVKSGYGQSVHYQWGERGKFCLGQFLENDPKRQIILHAFRKWWQNVIKISFIWKGWKGWKLVDSFRSSCWARFRDTLGFCIFFYHPNCAVYTMWRALKWSPTWCSLPTSPKFGE